MIEQVLGCLHKTFIMANPGGPLRVQPSLPLKGALLEPSWHVERGHLPGILTANENTILHDS